MSSLIGMEISGIRSFGLEEPRQRIKFYTPLTLILGQNGCGKTTIIEALKYITTGDAPPGCGKGGSFVHDPKLAKESQVRGQIKLKFSNIRSLCITSTRSLEAIQKPKKLEFRTLDATMRRENEDGTVDEISSKCVEFEYEMINALGVSKPILNNVIFCHQEEANWPLDEGKKVKEKFDAIFSATKYIKCLDVLRKKRKALKDEVRNDKEILKEMEKLKVLAANKRKELQTQEASLATLKDRRKELENDMQPIASRIEDVRKLINDINVIKLKHMSKKEKLSSVRKAQEELREGQQESIKCSDMELRIMIQDFQRSVTEKERELNTVESNIREVEREMDQSYRDIKKLEARKNNLEYAHNNHLSDIDLRNKKLKKYVAEHNISEFEAFEEFSDDVASSVLAKLNDEIRDLQENIVTKKKDFEDIEALIQNDIDSLRRKEAALDQEIKSRGQQIQEYTLKIRELRRKLMQYELELADNSLESIQADLEQVEKELAKQEGKLDIHQAKDKIETAKTSRRGIERKLDDNKRIVNKMNRQAEARSKLDIHVTEQKELENKIQYLKRKHADELEHLLGEVPEENLRNKLDACARSLRQRSTELRQDKDHLNKLKTKLDANIESDNKQLSRREQEIKDLERKTMEICQGEDLNIALEKSRKSKEDLTRERGDLSSSITVLNRFIDKLKQRDCCPLCHRDFSKKDECTQLVEELETKVSSVPSKLKNVKQKLEIQEKVYDQMVGLKPQRDQANRLIQEADKIREQIQKNLKELEKVKTDLEGKNEELDLINSDEETARLVQHDVVIIDNNMKRIKQLQEDIDDLKSTLGSADGGMSMEEAMKQQSDLEEEIRKYRNIEAEIQDKLEEHKDKLQALKDRKLRLSTQELELKTKLQETEKLKESLISLEESKAKCGEELEKAKEEVAPYKYQIDSKSEEKRKKIKEREEWIEIENNKIQAVREKSKSVNNLHKTILDYKLSGKEKRLQESKQELRHLESKVTSSETRKKSLEGQLRQLEKDLSNQKEEKRNLDDEMRIREKEKEAKILHQEIAELDKAIKEGNEDTLIEEKCRLSAEYEKMYKEMHNIDGTSEAVSNDIKKLNEELRSKEMRDADKNYKEKCLLQMCKDKSADDINKYYKALDTAIMRFHAEKMRNINDIIRSQWRITYKGNDIDYIEVKTDETFSVGADKRRTYQYRVVMVKGNTEMDMRGRCSAGQKVLASLIIRMALAETFSFNCGILALDEPTTNLDSENIEALAHALMNIVNKRRNQKNFQLIVITHDSSFLQKLSMADCIDYYYSVSRNEKGLSTIQRKEARYL
ncbi:hypothetical protein SK128_026094 [Halocaridina rubra]|uniref:Zinc-hook domain-containing protein n=1 Tax=Halocaridina rubra TaxID=373956 RepID=A0AAN8XG76_HALRR